MATNQGFKSLVPDPARADPKFLYWWLRTHRSTLESIGNGATFKEISKRATAGIPISLPPIEEQRRIAAVLDAADALRAKCRQALAKLDTLTQAIFIDMFGDPELNESGWPVASLGDLIEVGPQNGVYRPAKDYGAGVRIVRIESFNNGIITNLPSLKRVALSESEVRTYRLAESDLLINRVNSRSHLGKSAIVPPLDGDVVFESNIMRIRLAGNVALPEFVISLLHSRSVKRQILQCCKDAINQSSINQGDVRALRIVAPPLRLQRRFAVATGGLAMIKASLAAQSSELDDLLASLQQRAFRGEL